MLGVAFQIQDDILNIVGEKFSGGKGGVGEGILVMLFFLHFLVVVFTASLSCPCRRCISSVIAPEQGAHVYCACAYSRCILFNIHEISEKVKERL